MTFILVALMSLIIVLYAWYIVIVSRRNKALEALSSVDVQIMMRSELIPNILQIAKRFMEHELGLFQDITQLRTKVAAQYNPKDVADVKEHLSAASALETKLNQLMIQVEAYPALKSDQTMLQAQTAYQNVEENIAAARRFYNSGVNSYNNSVQIFPGNLLARMIGMEKMPFYVAEEQGKKAVNANEYL